MVTSGNVLIATSLPLADGPGRPPALLPLAGGLPSTPRVLHVPLADVLTCTPVVVSGRCHEAGLTTAGRRHKRPPAVPKLPLADGLACPPEVVCSAEPTWKKIAQVTAGGHAKQPASDKLTTAGGHALASAIDNLGKWHKCGHQPLSSIIALHTCFSH